MRTDDKQARAAALFSILCCLGLFLLGALVTPALGGSVRLRNGDRMTGEIIMLEDGRLVISTDYAGEVTVDIGQVVSIETSRAVHITMQDGAERTCYIAMGQDGTMILLERLPPEAEMQADAEKTPTVAPAAIALSELKSLGPVTAYYRYNGHVDMGLNGSTGNTNTTNLNLSAFLEPSLGTNTISLSGQVNRQTSEGDTTAQNWRILGQYEHDLGGRWFGAVFNSYENDKLQDLDLRFTAGAGIGYTIFQSSPTLLKVQAGTSWVRENFVASPDNQFAALRWKLDFSQDIFSSRASLYHQHTLTAGVTDNQFIVLTVTGVRLDLIADLSLRAELQFDLNSAPAAGAKEDDERYILKLSYEFHGDETHWWR